MPRSLRPLLLTICALVLLAPATAARAQQPAPVAIDGDPLNIYATADGSIQVNVEGAAGSEFFPPTGFDPVTSDSIPSQTASAGFGIILDPANTQSFSPRYGRFIAGSMGTPESGPTVTGPGVMETTWVLNDAHGNPTLRVNQTLRYVDRSRQVDASLNVTNISSNPVTFRANIAGDLAIRGTDHGIGFLLGNPPIRFIGGQNQAVGAAGGFVEQTPWASFETNNLGSVSSHASDGSGPGFDNTVSIEDSDNAAGVQWDDFYSTPLQPNASHKFDVGLRFVDTLGLDPVRATAAVGSQHSVTVTAADLNGQRIPNQRLDYTVEGQNPTSGNVTTNADGQATIAWVGANVGEDTLTVFEDRNKNGVRDEDESQAIGTVTWEGDALPPPEIGETAGVKPVAGKVKIKLPKGTSQVTAKRMGLTGAATKFQPLTSSARIPMGSTLDTSKGTVQLLSAGSKPSPVTGKSTYQSGNFKNGLFTIGQTRKNPLMQLSMTGGGLTGCATKPSKGGAASARSRKRRLFGNAHGRFRTRGRHSSATVRGTEWSMTDTCRGTLTVVKRGSVSVRDFSLKKTKIVKAGKRYFAKAPKLKRKRR